MPHSTHAGRYGQDAVLRQTMPYLPPCHEPLDRSSRIAGDDHALSDSLKAAGSRRCSETDHAPLAATWARCSLNNWMLDILGVL